MKNVTRFLSLLLLLSLCLSLFAACDTSDGGDDVTLPATVPTTDAPTEAPTDAPTEAPEPALVVDSTYRIVISAEADETTRKAADALAASIKEKASLELSIDRKSVV